MFSKKYQCHWLSLSFVLMIVGSAFKVAANPADRPRPDLALIESPLLVDEKMHQQNLSESSSNVSPKKEFERAIAQKSLIFADSTDGESESAANKSRYLSQFPNPIPSRTPESPIPTLPPPPDDPLQPTPPTLPAPPTRPEAPGNITVERFEFEGNTAFTAEELAEVTKQFTGKPITFAELLQAEATVTKLYIDAGYINSGAVIPTDQTLPVSGAVVKIQVIEGGVEDIKVTGSDRLNAEYVRSRLAAATKKPLNRNRLLQALQLLQLDPLIGNVSAELSAGARPELSLLEVTIQEANSFNTELFADNGRSPSVGSFRRGIRLNEGNLLGLGDKLSLGYTNTSGSNAIDGSYTVPFNSRNGTISVSGGLTNTQVIEPPFDRVDIKGESRYLDISVRQPLILTPTQEFALGLTGSFQHSQTTLLGENFPLSPGANDNGVTRISALRFFQEYTQRSPNQVFAARSQFSLGLGILNSTVNDDAADSRFLSWRGQAQYVRLLAPDTLLVLRTDAQLADQTLLPLEQFGLGGFRNVRGYRQDVLLTDMGVLASAELLLPILRVKKVEGLLQVVPFIDFGYGTNRGATPDPEQETLLGVGVGLQLSLGDRFSARLDYGIPLIEIDSSGDRTLQEKGIYFSIDYNPF